MHDYHRFTLNSLTTIGLASALLVAGCSDDVATESGSGSETGTGDGDGDMTGEETSTTEMTTTGDGDGDGDPTTTGDGDGDGDPTTTGDGDGDGDPTTTGGPICGDGVVEGDEECDDGNQIEDDDCLNSCVAASCGDGIVWVDNEDCDLGDLNDDAGECTTLCTAAACGDGFVWADNEACDDAGESETCDLDCTPAECGDGVVNATALEDCDDQNEDDTDACVACVAAACGDGFVQAGVEACDDGNVEPGDGCSETCELESCVWDIDNLPLPVAVHPSNHFGEISFDSSCNLIVTGAFTNTLYRVSGLDGSVSSVVMNIANNSINGATYRASDSSVYVTLDNPNQLWRLEPDDTWTMVAALPQLPNGVAVAPEGFGDFGDMLIWGSSTGNLFATDPGDGSSTQFGTNGGTAISSVAFAPDGTLYVVAYNTGVISTVDAGGQFVQFFDMAGSADGLAFNADGSVLYVSHFGNGTGVDALTVPGAQYSQVLDTTFDGGYYPSGLLVDGGGHLLFKSQVNAMASVSGITP